MQAHTGVPTFTEVEVAADATAFARLLEQQRISAESRIIEVRNRTLTQRWSYQRIPSTQEVLERELWIEEHSDPPLRMRVEDMEPYEEV
jgi:hypothetical protein